MTDKPKVVAIELSEDEMVIVLLTAITGMGPPEDISTATAIADIERHDPEGLKIYRRAVRKLMEYWRSKIISEVGPKAVRAAGIDPESGRLQ